MAERIDLITDQDIEAYVDGAVSGDRLRAIEAKLIKDARAMGRAIRTLRQSADLRELKSVLYRDLELSRELEHVLSMRRSGKGALAG